MGYSGSGQQQVEEMEFAISPCFKKKKFDEQSNRNAAENSGAMNRKKSEENCKTADDGITLDDCYDENFWSTEESSGTNDSSSHNRASSEADSFDMESYADDLPSYSDMNEKEEEDPYDVLCTDQLVQSMASTMQETNVILRLPPTTMRQLLNHFRWDMELLLEAYYSVTDDKGMQEFFKKAKVAKVNAIQNEFPAPAAVNEGKTEDCQICYLEQPKVSMFGLKCGHCFCTACWTEYLTSKILEGGTTQAITCAAHNCPVLVDDDTVMNLLADPLVKVKYQQLITNSFVQCNRYMRWCPSPGCSNAIKVKWLNGLSRSVSCSCRHSFCFKCGKNAHFPIDCEMVKKWLKKCEDDTETSNWIIANTKECPKCAATIEKDGGCNHVACKNCGTDFCWACMKLTHYACNAYVEPDKEAAKNSSRIALSRYLFYFNRYKNHSRSLELEKKLYDSVRDFMTQIQSSCGISWVEVQFLHKAVNVLCECRETLLSTYIFAYYVEKTNEKEIFEDNQHDLESATEKLSGYLETQIGFDDLSDIKTKVQDMVNYCASRRQVLIDHVREGHEKDSWKFKSLCSSVAQQT